MITIEHDEEVHDKLAEQVRKALEQNPRLTMNLLASQLDSTMNDIHHVLDEYHVVDGKSAHFGPGLGGSWVPLEQQDEAYAVGEPTVGGFRWPDGELREDPYDSNA